MNKYKKKDAPPSDCNGDNAVTVSEFDYCVDNHFRTIETISKLCGEDDYYALQQTEIQRFSSSLTFFKVNTKQSLYCAIQSWTFLFPSLIMC